MSEKNGEMSPGAKWSRKPTGLKARWLGTSNSQGIVDLQHHRRLGHASKRGELLVAPYHCNHSCDPNTWVRAHYCCLLAIIFAIFWCAAFWTTEAEKTAKTQRKMRQKWARSGRLTRALLTDVT